MKRTLLLISLSSALLLLAACGGGESESASPPPAAQSPPAGQSQPAAQPQDTAQSQPPGQAGQSSGDGTGQGQPPAVGDGDGDGPRKTLNFAVFSVIDTLEPTNAWDSWYVVRIGVGENLVRFSKTMAPEPWLAESWTLADDKLTWTFKIREGVKFSNNKPLDAAAAKRSIERVQRLAPDRVSSEFFLAESIEADGMNLVIKTAGPTPGLPGILADPLFLILDAEADDASVKANGPVCTGPYKYLPRSGDNINAVRNDLYWAGRPRLDEVNFIAVTDPNTRALALQSGDVDIAANMGNTDVPIFLSDPDFKVEEIESLRLVMAFMNLKGPLADESLRKAVKSAIDLETLCATLLSGRFSPGVGPLPPSLGFGFSGLRDPNAFDLEKARADLAEGGWSDADGDGVVEKDGVPAVIDYVYYTDRLELPLLVEATQDSLSALGIKVNLNAVEYNNLAARRKSGDFGMLIMNIITAGTGDPQSFLVSQFETGAFNNSNSYSNPELDAIFAELKTEFDPDRRSELVARAQQSLLDHPAHVFYAYPNTNLVHNLKVTGVEMLPADYYWVTTNIDKTM
ncbi:MAG: ABC transporter substrate-binding protein [Deltaproteobacteria bacterium]|jgi:peptide/nickel transport system substrate-binding protein|nr:ABC transporter substrate-binding protein [Deltaproteobacteria bacterium]